MSELTNLQRKTLNRFAESDLNGAFYWTGGTALAVVYLHHRLSYDLDFFSEETFTPDAVRQFVAQLKENTDLDNVEEKRLYERYEFFLHNETEIRLEFVQYGHPAIGERGEWQGVTIDSLDDIAANKTMALIDRAEVKDAVDVYFLLTQVEYTVGTLLDFVEKKFGVRIAESVLWSESVNALRELPELEPVLLPTNERDPKDIMSDIREYFEGNARDFVKDKLE